MRIVIAGGTGFLGRPLAASLAADGHDVVILTRGAAAPSGRGTARDPSPGHPTATPAPGRRAIDGADAVVNLAGESIAGRRWSAAQKTTDSRQPRAGDAQPGGRDQPPAAAAAALRQRIGRRLLRPARRRDRDRGDAGRLRLSRAASACSGKPRRCAPPATARASSASGPGSSLERDGGALPPMLPPFKLGVGRTGRIGPSVLAVDSPRTTGSRSSAGRSKRQPCRARSMRPRRIPVTNADFARALGHAHASSGVHAGARFRVAIDAGRDGRRAGPLRPARVTGEGAEPGLWRSSTRASTTPCAQSSSRGRPWLGRPRSQYAASFRSASVILSAFGRLAFSRTCENGGCVSG